MDDTPHDLHDVSFRLEDLARQLDQVVTDHRDILPELRAEDPEHAGDYQTIDHLYRFLAEVFRELVTLRRAVDRMARERMEREQLAEVRRVEPVRDDVEPVGDDDLPH